MWYRSRFSRSIVRVDGRDGGTCMGRRRLFVAQAWEIRGTSRTGHGTTAIFVAWAWKVRGTSRTGHGTTAIFVSRSCAPGTTATARPCVCFAALVLAVCAGRRRMRRFRMQRTIARGLFQAHHGCAVGVECGLAQGLGQHVRGVLGGGNVVRFDDLILDQLADEQVAPGDVL